MPEVIPDTQPLYFAYGSNLCVHQMAQRCPAARVVGPAVLEGYRLTFPRRGSNWPGGVAGIIAHADGRVEGAVYRVTADCLAALDRLEGVEAGRYARRVVSVRNGRAVARDAFAYIAAVESGGPFGPSLTYLRTMLRGAEAHGLSDGYIAWLRAMLSPAAPSAI